MREIKFRAWSKLGSRFWYFDYTKGFNAENNDRFTHPMQYTGLKDKNRVEIYEGDIVKWSVDYELADGDVSISEVKFIDGHFWPVTNPTHTCYYGVSNPETVVIGNIHENPELLENDNENK